MIHIDKLRCLEGICISNRGVTLSEDASYLLYGDPRMSEYPLMKCPLSTLILVALYALFVYVVGPAWMKNREPYNLRRLMITHNTILVILNIWVFLNFGMSGWFTTYKWRCEPIDFSYNSNALKMVQICWIFLIMRFLEFGDTIIFVLRKKNNQVTKLHVFHHCLSPIAIWIVVKYGPGGYNTLYLMINSFVHIWMYLYYALSAIGPSMQKYLWWKKYLTSLQLMQFILVIWYMTYLQFFADDSCKVFPLLIWLSIIEAAMFLVLFLHFYKQTYTKKNR